MHSDPVRLFQTQPHACGYFPERLAGQLVVDPDHPDPAALYDLALERGFRRSGAQLYLPHCQDCRACRPSRIDVAGFRPDRSQRRTLRDNRDLQIRLLAADLDPERLDLYRRYLRHRHPGGGMDAPGPEDFLGFLTAPWSPTRFMEFRLDGELLAVAVIDIGDRGVSAVYTFYAPEHAGRGLGTLAILQQIELARQRGLAWVYLGFWIEAHPKMDYKRRFQPLQLRGERGWAPMPPPAAR